MAAWLVILHLNESLPFFPTFSHICALLGMCLNGLFAGFNACFPIKQWVFNGLNSRDTFSLLTGPLKPGAKLVISSAS